MITNAPWFVPNELLHRDLRMPTMRQEIVRHTKLNNERSKKSRQSATPKKQNATGLNLITVIKTTV